MLLLGGKKWEKVIKECREKEHLQGMIFRGYQGLEELCNVRVESVQSAINSSGNTKPFPWWEVKSWWFNKYFSSLYIHIFCLGGTLCTVNPCCEEKFQKLDLCSCVVFCAVVAPSVVCPGIINCGHWAQQFGTWWKTLKQQPRIAEVPRAGALAGSDTLACVMGSVWWLSPSLSCLLHTVYMVGPSCPGWQVLGFY